MAVILGTAGHIDHGKTQLIRSLTNIDCDRLDEEKKRGITIDLGFAWLDLPNGDRLGIIDVPGHERFVRTMVAGACGIDFVLLVIAADEGIMPQTREHLEICQLLGVTRGLCAITKVDMVDQEWLTMVTGEISDFLKGTFLENAPLFPVSSVTGEGLPALREALIHEAQTLSPKPSTDIFRLPVDRVFTMHGHGTVVTGTVISGDLHVGSPLSCMPQAKQSRARSIQRHNTSVDTISMGCRCAINLQGLEIRDVHRGDVITKPGELIPSKRWFLHLRSLSSSPISLKQRGEIHFHHATKECTARLIFRDRTSLVPGSDAFCEATFSEDMCGVFGDRCVLRGASPLRTVAGATILSPCPPFWPKKRHDDDATCKAWLELLPLAQAVFCSQKKEERIRNAASFLHSILRLHGIPGVTEDALRVLSGLSRKDIDNALSFLASKGLATLWDKEERAWISHDHFEQLESACLEKAEQLHKKNPLQLAFARNALLSAWSKGLPEKLAQRVIDQAIREQKIILEGDGLRLTSHKVSLDLNEEELRSKILLAHKGIMDPPNYKDVLERFHLTEKEAAPVLALLVSQGALIRVKDGLYYERETLDHILTLVKEWFTTNNNLDIAGLKSILGLSRKYLVALLEYMDNAHITVRVGDLRTLRHTQEKK